ncbi:MAG: NAD-dependent epimerase/dehydratase family protein [Cyclobacteriaceae bacterium]|jgi:nucleoside-diphosphate-sugar epimerase|nr:NAD-dependent epimerase/dehydratase family protein [Cyclobacteriaceae bacterium]
MKKIFVTGGSGFVGRKLIQRLVYEGCHVIALSRTESSDKVIKGLGAFPLRGDLHSAEALAKGVADADTVFHLAASVDFWKSREELHDDHVAATKKLLALAAAKTSKVNRFVYLSAASVVMNGQPILHADESFRSDRLIDGYSQTKLEAETLVLKAATSDFGTVAIRPPLIWGRGDTSALPQIKAAALNGQLAFIGGGRHKFVTCHVQNVCHALLLAAQSEVSGETFFVTDGEKLEFKQFITDMLKTQHVVAPNRSVPLRVAKAMARFFSFTWRTLGLKGHPPLYPGMVNALGLPFIVSDQKARDMLGYQPIVSVRDGLQQMYS